MGKRAQAVAITGSALIALLSCNSVVAATVTSIRLDIASLDGGNTTLNQDCTGNVCSLPTSTPLPIPYPLATIDTTNGVLHGRMRVEVNLDRDSTEAAEVSLQGTVSFRVMGQAYIIMGAPTVLVELGMVGITGSPTFSNSSTLKAGACGPFTECHDQTVTTNASFGVLNAAGDVVASRSSDGSVSAGREGGPWDGQQSLAVTDSLEAPVEERFGLFWTFTTLLHLDRQRHRGLHYAENDFSHTLGFTGMNFHDAAGNDVTQWIGVTYDSPLTFLAAPVPEPETYAMMLAGLGLLGLVARRRKQTPA